jgi:uncharacterized protein (DUF58 family)
VEGADVPIELELDVASPVRPRSALVVQRIAKLGERVSVLERSAGTLRARFVLRGVPRGRYAFADARAVVEDPLGLERARAVVPGAGALLVYPRLVELGSLFSESGAQLPEGRRLLLRRPTGFDFHSVRDYEQGESLRRVHWRTTARRGQLMVKELEDAPRDEVAIVLDASPASVAGRPPDSSFDAQVRAAGSLLQAHARHGRRAVLAVNDAELNTLRVGSSEGDWRRALELLASVEPTGRTPLAALLSAEGSAAVRALELTVVTGELSKALVDRLIERVLSRRACSLVYVDCATFDGAPPRREPALLQLRAAGVPLALVRRGDDLAAALTARPLADHA